MAFTVSKTNGVSLVTIQDFSVNNTSTSITLIGRGVPNYPGIIATDFVRLLENFSAQGSPTSPLIGQLWMDLSTNLLRFYSPSLTWDALATQNWVEGFINGSLITTTPGQYTKVTVNSSGLVTSGTQIDAADVETALGYVPFNPASFPNVTSGQYTKVTVNTDGFVTVGSQINATDVETALGFVPFSSSGGTVSGNTTIDGVFSVNGNTILTGGTLSLNYNNSVGTNIYTLTNGNLHIDSMAGINKLTLDTSGNVYLSGSQIIVGNPGNPVLYAPPPKIFWVSYSNSDWTGGSDGGGTYIIVPPNVYRILVKLVGGGGGGGAAGLTNAYGFGYAGGGGGGAGGYAEGSYGVTPGEKLYYIIGVGGTGSGIPADLGQTGGSTSLASLISASGGGGGGGGDYPAPDTNYGGAGGLGYGGQFLSQGQPGGDGGYQTADGSGNGGDSLLGGGGRASIQPDHGVPGSNGGGGGGSYDADGPGGDGGQGAIIIYY